MIPEIDVEHNRERNILVVGGAGYIGSVLCRLLLGNGYRITVLDDLIYGNGATLADLFSNDRFSFVKGDLCHEPVVEAALEGVTDVVLMAAFVGDPICRKYPDLARRVNEDGCIRVFDAIRGRGIGKFVFLSTCSNYGLLETDALATEETALNPQSLYAETKVAVEGHILQHVKDVDFAPVILRLATAFGFSLRMRFDLTVSDFCRYLVLGKDLLVYDEDTWRPYCHVDDISRAILSVVEAPAEAVAGQVFNAGSDTENYTKKMIVEHILPHVPGANVQYKKGGFDPRNYRVSFDKIAQTLGFRVRHSVKDSVSALVNALENHVFDDVEDRKNFYGNYSVLGG